MNDGVLVKPRGKRKYAHYEKRKWEMQGGSREERRAEGWTESEVVGKSTGLRNRTEKDESWEGWCCE